VTPRNRHGGSHRSCNYAHPDTERNAAAGLEESRAPGQEQGAQENADARGEFNDLVKEYGHHCVAAVDPLVTLQRDNPEDLAADLNSRSDVVDPPRGKSVGCDCVPWHIVAGGPDEQSPASYLCRKRGRAQCKNSGDDSNAQIIECRLGASPHYIAKRETQQSDAEQPARSDYQMGATGQSPVHYGWCRFGMFWSTSHCTSACYLLHNVGRPCEGG